MAFYVTPLAPIRATPVSYIEDRITHDARDGWPVEPGRYRLIAARACPWANRAVIVRRLLGLEDAISLGMPGQTHDARSWTFDLETEWSDYVRDGAPELYPEASRAEIDDVNDKVFLDVNNGPYRASFAGSRRAYEDAYRRLFAGSTG